MEMQYIFEIVTIVVSVLLGFVAKAHPKFNNKLIPLQNLIIGVTMMIINYCVTKNLNESIMVSGLLAGGIYDLGKNLREIVGEKIE